MDRDDRYDQYIREEMNFRDPGGRSALRAGARLYPCPDCGRPNQLTKKDVELKYRCDRCADAAEGHYGMEY